VVKFWRWRVDGQKSWATLQKMLADISPRRALNGLNAPLPWPTPARSRKDPGLRRPQKSHRQPRRRFHQLPEAPTGTALEDLNNAPSLFLFAAVNADQAVLAIKNVVSLTAGRQKAPGPRDFLGKKIYTIPLPSPRMPGVPGADATAVPTRALYCAASGGYVAVTTDVSMLEEYLRSGEKPVKPLGGTPGLIDAAAYIGGTGNGLFGYENQRETA
jgi:hypothetical protein